MDEYIPFNKVHLTGQELGYMQQAMQNGKLSGNGHFTQACEQFFQQRYGFKKAILTSSCTDALEMCALLLNVQPGDEIIMPSYTFVSTANAFALRGAKIIFADSESNSPNIDVSQIEQLITSKTKAIVCVHYGGKACDMNALMALAKAHKIWVVEDAAHAIEAFYLKQPLGGFGHLSTFSFHDSKNITCGEGGLLVINDEQFVERAEIIRDKGTNRNKFLLGEVEKYEWVDLGSSFSPNEMTAAFLLAQLEGIETIQQQRKKLWQHYYNLLQPLHHQGLVQIPQIPSNAQHNAHLFYVSCLTKHQREALQQYLKVNGIEASFHYQSLHQSPYFAPQHDDRNLVKCEKYSDGLLRLPLYHDLTIAHIERICRIIINYFETQTSS